jgi:hypothetical protein
MSKASESAKRLIEYEKNCPDPRNFPTTQEFLDALTNHQHGLMSILLEENKILAEDLALEQEKEELELLKKADEIKKTEEQNRLRMAIEDTESRKIENDRLFQYHKSRVQKLLTTDYNKTFEDADMEPTKITEAVMLELVRVHRRLEANKGTLENLLKKREKFERLKAEEGEQFEKAIIEMSKMYSIAQLSHAIKELTLYDSDDDDRILAGDDIEESDPKYYGDDMNPTLEDPLLYMQRLKNLVDLKDTKAIKFINNINSKIDNLYVLVKTELEKAREKEREIRQQCNNKIYSLKEIIKIHTSDLNIAQGLLKTSRRQIEAPKHNENIEKLEKEMKMLRERVEEAESLKVELDKTKKMEQKMKKESIDLKNELETIKKETKKKEKEKEEKNEERKKKIKKMKKKNKELVEALSELESLKELTKSLKNENLTLTEEFDQKLHENDIRTKNLIKNLTNSHEIELDEVRVRTTIPLLEEIATHQNKIFVAEQEKSKAIIEKNTALKRMQDLADHTSELIKKAEKDGYDRARVKEVKHMSIQTDLETSLLKDPIGIGKDQVTFERENEFYKQLLFAQHLPGGLLEFEKKKQELDEKISRTMVKEEELMFLEKKKNETLAEQETLLERLQTFDVTKLHKIPQTENLSKILKHLNSLDPMCYDLYKKKFFSYTITDWTPFLKQSFKDVRFLYLKEKELDRLSSSYLFQVLTEINMRTGSKSHLWYGNELNRLFHLRDFKGKPKDLFERANLTFLGWYNTDAKEAFYDMKAGIPTIGAEVYKRLLCAAGNVGVPRTLGYENSIFNLIEK